MSFLYGNHITKAALARITQNTPMYQGVVVYNMNDVALGLFFQRIKENPCLSILILFHLRAFARGGCELHRLCNNGSLDGRLSQVGTDWNCCVSRCDVVFAIGGGSSLSAYSIFCEHTLCAHTRNVVADVGEYLREEQSVL